MDDSIDRRTWFEGRIFLVDKPLTFGHSQIVVECHNDKEEEHFRQASLLITHTIRVFNKAFGENKIHEKEQFKKLAFATCTEGGYLKTLILRSSANEDANQYKIHMVPYFCSHAEACEEFYHFNHPNSLEKTGGLLGWLGKRETKIDCWSEKKKLQGLLEILTGEFKKLL